ncbi:hypothetical protein, partial [Escherichia coli]|uniref:hypothetical protein n=1 Tax=Escherichia coli TaxID=562 RepID=UPI001BFE5904|nr:C4-dicarboxylate ABC transporter [Escherichia coli]
LLQSWAQLIASGLLLFSSIRYFQILQNSGVPVEHPLLHYIWMALFTLLLLINLKRVIRPVTSPHGTGTWGGAMLSIPLYAQMATIAGTYFVLKGHDAGLAIYINQLMEL